MERPFADDDWFAVSAGIAGPITYRRQAAVHRDDADADRFTTTPPTAPYGRSEPPTDPASG